MTTVLDVSHSLGKWLRVKVAQKRWPIHSTNMSEQLMKTILHISFGLDAL